ncbi:IclR family transcriptional regulator [Pseudonocardia asaccharolytica]|uniref:IclR family transcriptional regulator n=1 Tax=Pseudonocardia asaccharolytica DSM 44247 = NBRC 16224 TaxID=1123024 RepID=A0A511CV43_9PSEU|nr:IclR family transcriptional regulator C-terminal domain-containing protein [Pseudonocardia asaccharolytica]GEL16421.1 IclR family transcriptional regulator [Pseudonocardia asaccharolytica DSM 44247 = NBRC 16224]
MTPQQPHAGSSALRALRVVEAIAAAGDGVTAKAIARRLGCPLPTIYRVLGTLVEEGYLVRLHDVRGYGLGYQIAHLHRSLADQVLPPTAVRAIVPEVHAAARAATYLLVFRDLDIVVAYLDTCAEHPGLPGMRVAEPASPHSTAGGKALLAGLDAARLGAVLARSGLPRISRRTVSERRALDRELMRVRSAGVAVEVEEHQRGFAGVAVPVRGPGGETTAALGVSVSRGEFTARRWELEDAVRSGAIRIIRALAVTPGAALAP